MGTPATCGYLHHSSGRLCAEEADRTAAIFAEGRDGLETAVTSSATVCLAKKHSHIARPPNQTDEALRRMGRAPLRGNTTLVSIDVATREQTTIAAPPGIKFFPAVLNDGEIAYVRKDGDDRGIAYSSTGKKGPLGLVRSPSWSPDGKRVVYHRLLGQNVPAWQKAWSRNPGYDLVTTNSLASVRSVGQASDCDLPTTPRFVQIEPGRNVAQHPVPAGREACAIGRLVSAR